MVEVHGSLGAHPSVFYWGCWRINNDWDFVTRGYHLPLVTFTQRTLSVHCITRVQGRKRSSHNVWTLSPTLLLCACRRLKRLGKSPPSTLQSRPSLHTHPSIWVCKRSDERLGFYDQWGSPEAVYYCLWTAKLEFHCRRIFKISRMMTKMYQLGWGICTEVNIVGRFVSHTFISMCSNFLMTFSKALVKMFTYTGIGEFKLHICVHILWVGYIVTDSLYNG